MRAVQTEALPWSEAGVRGEEGWCLTAYFLWLILFPFPLLTG